MELTGGERFSGIDASVLDFWRFAMSDLRMNNTRGYLAEFLVAVAVGASTGRVEWDAYDVLTPSGVRIEVKSSAFVQSWAQEKLSTVRFSGLLGRAWTADQGRAGVATYNADVYVFCVQTCMVEEDYDPLDVGQWNFYVLPRSTVASLARASVGLSTLTSAAGPPVAFTELGRRIESAAHPEGPDWAVKDGLPSPPRQG